MKDRVAEPNQSDTKSNKINQQNMNNDKSPRRVKQASKKPKPEQEDHLSESKKKLKVSSRKNKKAFLVKPSTSSSTAVTLNEINLALLPPPPTDLPPPLPPTDIPPPPPLNINKESKGVPKPPPQLTSQPILANEKNNPVNFKAELFAAVAKRTQQKPNEAKVSQPHFTHKNALQAILEAEFNRMNIHERYKKASSSDEFDDTIFLQKAEKIQETSEVAIVKNENDHKIIELDEDVYEEFHIPIPHRLSQKKEKPETHPIIDVNEHKETKSPIPPSRKLSHKKKRLETPRDLNASLLRVNSKPTKLIKPIKPTVTVAKHSSSFFCCCQTKDDSPRNDVLNEMEKVPFIKSGRKRK